MLVDKKGLLKKMGRPPTIVLVSSFLCILLYQNCGKLGNTGAPTNLSNSLPSSAQSTPNPCINQGFVSGSISPNPVIEGSPFTLLCNYGVQTNNISSNLKGASFPSNSCTWVNFNGTSAVFNCIAGTTPGSYPISCTLGVISQNQYCPETNPIGNLQVVSPTLMINAGGASYVNSLGQTWSADEDFSGGTAHSVTQAITNTSDQGVYQSERYQASTYTIPAGNGVHSVTLKFAEITYSGAGVRVFNVVINGTQVLTNFDVFQSAGGEFIALDKAFNVTVTTGQIVIQLVPVTNDPTISGIVVN